MPRTVDPALSVKRRKQILDAAAECFSTRGFHQTTMQEITAASGMSAGGLYRYFKSKDDIIAGIAEEEGAEYEAVIDFLKSAADPLNALELATPEILRELKDPGQGRLAIEVAAEALRNPRVADIVRNNEHRFKLALAEVFEAGQKNGTIDSSLPAGHLAELVSSVFSGLVTAGLSKAELGPKELQPSIIVLLRRLLRP